MLLEMEKTYERVSSEILLLNACNKPEIFLIKILLKLQGFKIIH